MHQKKKLFRSSRINKTLRCFGLIPSALFIKTTILKMDKRKLNIAMAFLQEVSVEGLEAKEFIDKKLEQKSSKESISIYYVKGPMSYIC